MLVARPSAVLNGYAQAVVLLLHHGKPEHHQHSIMAYQFLANLLLVLHAGFIGFAVFGGLMVLHRRWWVCLHLPAAVWAATVVSMGWICPLTPWEQELRRAAGQQGFTGGFIEHYLLAAIYPDGLTRGIQIWLGAGVTALNLLVYGFVWKKRSARQKTR
jgi:phosphotransferase system  glucose/maltose/N-acetylglucosamine-specific IIC component